ncbi:MAG: hypothetical protein FGM24_00705 [Candidatus Kapabacteria bacterium]|nr:hypothetical protein [Candidatus Kapabacteria bacterium]
MYRHLVIAIVIAMGLVACTQVTEPAPNVDGPTLSLIASSDTQGYTVDLLAEGLITVGYTPLYVRLKHSGSVVTNATVTIISDMDMGMHHHACPVDQPVGTSPDQQGYYHTAALFTMPSTTAWTITIKFHDNDHDSSGEVTVVVPVGAAERVRTGMDASGMKYVIALQCPTEKVGLNDIKFGLYKTMDGFDFIPVNDATVSFNPSMPSMGHGSHGNVQPVSRSNGWYSGQVNYTMTGDWQIDATVDVPGGQQFSVSYPVSVK